MSRKYFGIDGICGCVGEFLIILDFVFKLGWVVGMVFCWQGNCWVLIGKDMCSLGYMFELVFEVGFFVFGVDILLLGLMFIFGIVYLMWIFYVEVGVVISVLYNFYDDNGIKFFFGQGIKLLDDVELMIEELFDVLMIVVEFVCFGKVLWINDVVGCYIEFCKSSVLISIDFNGFKVVFDCVNGVIYKIVFSVFWELGVEVMVLVVSLNGLNINDKCGFIYLDGLQVVVVEYYVDFGIVFDGDGDWVMMVDYIGVVVDGDELFFFIVCDLQESGCL